MTAAAGEDAIDVAVGVGSQKIVIESDVMDVAVRSADAFEDVAAAVGSADVIEDVAVESDDKCIVTSAEIAAATVESGVAVGIGSNNRLRSVE